MKKLFLLAVTALVGFSANAQQAPPLHISGQDAQEVYNVKGFGNTHTSAKSSIAGGRWYNHAFLIDDAVVSGQMDYNFYPIWFDSTVKQRFNTGLGTINYSSLGQIVDPNHFTLYNDINISTNDPNDIAITMEQPYKIDSVSFFAYYVENIARPVTIVDTLIFSVSASGNGPETPYYLATPSNAPWLVNYTCTSCPDSFVRGFTIGTIDEPNRASGVTDRVMWKVPIDTSFRRPDSAGYIFNKEFTYPVMVNGVPGAANIPPGKTAAVTVTFKSGDIINPGDSFNHYHHMYVVSGEAVQGTYMPYYLYAYRDRNMSQLMFSTTTDTYDPTLFVETYNTNTFFKEFHDISAHLVCDNCPTVTEYSSVHNINSIVGTDMAAYPNPANNEINVSFIMNQNVNATVSITNAVGQVIATKEVANVIAKQNNIVTFSTADLSAGLYFYTVEAKGQRTTNRFVVTH